jgi:regulator of nucleoside diphosphate kinase
MTATHPPANTPQTSPPLVVTRLDCARLEALLDAHPSADARGLLAELERAQVVEPGDVPGDVIAMNSTARFRDEESGEEREITLVYPQDAGNAANAVSILAPVGSALLGLRVGHAIDWPMPGGRRARLHVLSVSHPPQGGDDLSH